MKKLMIILMVSLFTITFTSCSENYSTGEKIGTVTSFQKQGLLWDSWEGHLNITQTGMNSSTGLDFSVDNDKEDPIVVKTLDSAAQFGWKVKLMYHETRGWNWFHNRGHTSTFITKVEILERNFGNMFNGNSQNKQTTGNVIDTVFVVIVDKSRLKD